METETPTPEETAARPCASCASPLAADQDWCLECGSAQPGRLGARHGWRAALTVVGACGLLATGAGAAAYAALSSEAERVASAPAPPAGAPAVTGPPAQASPPAPAPETPVVEAPKTKPAPTPAPKSDPAPAATPSTPSTPSTGSSDADAPADEPAPIALKASSIRTYDPYDRGASGVGKPAAAVDGKESTAWQAPVGEDGSVRIGLAVSLPEARALRQLAFLADTPGFTVEVYGTRAKRLPPDVLDARWENLGTQSDVGVREEIDLEGKYRHVLLWVTAQPADTKVVIPELQLFD